MDLEEQIHTPNMANENIAHVADLQQYAADIEIERKRHERTKRASRRLQTQLNGFAEHDMQLREHIQTLLNTNSALAQEILRLRCTVDTLNGVIRMICGHVNGRGSTVCASGDIDGGDRSP